jgi:hypothetical protein
MEQPKCLKVKDLIKKLQSMNPELQVFVEGCDCIGEAENIEVWLKGLLITRSIPSHSYDKESGQDWAGLDD